MDEDPAGANRLLRSKCVCVDRQDVIEFETNVESSGPGPSVLQGQAAAWDPSTGAWTRLPAAPLYGGDVTVWDGDGLLEWGVLNTPSASGSESSATTGLQFGPGP